MGIRLSIKDEDENILMDGGAYNGIHELLDMSTETRNKVEESCSNPDCFMCECWDFTWYKVTIDMLKRVNKDVLDRNSNIIANFIVDDEFWKDKKVSEWNTVDFMLSMPHREFIWVNLS